MNRSTLDLGSADTFHDDASPQVPMLLVTHATRPESPLALNLMSVSANGLDSRAS